MVDVSNAVWLFWVVIYSWLWKVVQLLGISLQLSRSPITNGRILFPFLLIGESFPPFAMEVMVFVLVLGVVVYVTVILAVILVLLLVIVLGQIFGEILTNALSDVSLVALTFAAAQVTGHTVGAGGDSFLSLSSKLLLFFTGDSTNFKAAFLLVLSGPCDQLLFFPF